MPLPPFSDKGHPDMSTSNTQPNGAGQPTADEVAALKTEIERLRAGIKNIAYSGRTKAGMKQTALQLIGLFPS